MEIKPVRVDQNFKRNSYTETPSNNIYHKPCGLCSSNESEAQHYPLSNKCGVRKLSSQEILKVMDASRSCPPCGFSHYVNSTWRSTYQDGFLKACPKDCQHNGYPLNRAACKHITVYKVGSNKSIPLVETLYFGSTSVCIQYDAGCQLSLISKSALQVLLVDIYSIEKPTKVRNLAYAGEDEKILTAKVQLKLSSL